MSVNEEKFADLSTALGRYACTTSDLLKAFTEVQMNLREAKVTPWAQPPAEITAPQSDAQ